MSRRTGYDLGGAEYPYDPENLTVVDILKPADREGADWSKRNFNVRNWADGLEPRRTIYIGKTLRYLTEIYLWEFGLELDKIVAPGGTVIMFDHIRYIDPVMAALLDSQPPRQYEVAHIELINAPAGENGRRGEYQVVLQLLGA